ncbi:DUF2510 domain-containing protein [Streptomyces sp. NPDC050560]|uniref:DUF2510 domain-containing protein n=1 Tax=Streptomyces sp. NPDC050560 TaxID=3365630 RepID=UPI00379EB620
MSMTPAPGWYPEPNAPGTERWWNGTAWTEHRRPAPPPGPYAPQPPAVSQAPAAPRQPVAPQPPPAPAGFGPAPSMPPPRRGRARTYALAATAVVVVGAVVATVLLLTGDDDKPEAGPSKPATAREAGPHTTPTGSTASPSPSSGADDDSSVVTDDLNGITLPVLDGWKKPDYTSESDVLLISGDSYSCPVDMDVCYPGRVASNTVTGSDETSPKVLATDDISKAAGDIYDKDPTLDSRPYGGMTGHKKLKEGAVTVAGEPGYMVRWSVTTAKGPGHVVESLAFAPAKGSGTPVIVRFAFDTSGTDAPPAGDMDKFTAGIRAAD